MSPIRVLHCPETVGGNPVGLARAERELGIESWTVAFQRSPYGYEPDETLWRDGETFSNPVMSEFKRWRLLWRAVRDFDIVHFNFGCSIMPLRPRRDSPIRSNYNPILWGAYRVYASIFELRDLRLLESAGKGIVVTYQGDDARQGDFCLANFDLSFASEVGPAYYSRESDEFKRQRIATFARHADQIYALNPDLLHVLPNRTQFLPYSHVDLRRWRPIERPKSRNVPCVLHAPSHRGVKGTRFITAAVSRLQAEGLDLDFILAEGVPYAEARRLYERADLLIDQLLGGWYGGLAVELMALSKPVICYIRESDLRFLPSEMREELPVIRATPQNVYNILREWLTTRRHELPEVGRRSRAYVEKWHNPLKIAARLKTEYERIVASK